VKIYATDLDEEALHQARVGAYDEHALADLPGSFRESYFEPYGTRHAFRRDLRRQVIFGRNDLTHDAPISRVDLLVSRNTLMYFNAETQASIIRRFHFALSYPGYLFLGKAEMLLNYSERFQPVDLRTRIFRKVSPTTRLPGGPARWAESGDREPAARRLEAAALASVPVVQLATDLAGNLRVANAAAEALFNLRPRDLGRPFQDLEVSYRPVELRSRIEQARTDLRPAELYDVEWQRPGVSQPSYYDVSITPLFSGPGDLVGIGIPDRRQMVGVLPAEHPGGRAEGMGHAAQEPDAAVQRGQCRVEAGRVAGRDGVRNGPAHGGQAAEFLRRQGRRPSRSGPCRA
jgi:two-component system CheB/CheR fusion protein